MTIKMSQLDLWDVLFTCISTTHELSLIPEVAAHTMDSIHDLDTTIGVLVPQTLENKLEIR